MKAIRLLGRTSFDDLATVDLPPPVVGPRDVLLRMRAVSLNQRDVLVALGRYGDFPAPFVPASDGAGEVVETGAEVTRFRRGDLVLPSYVPDWLSGPPRVESGRRRLGGPVDGVLAELVAVHEEAAVLAPKGLSAVEAATLPIAAMTAYRVLFEHGAARPGKTIAVLGAGGVALFVAQLARAAGARPIVILRGAERAAHVRTMRACAIDTDETPGWEKVVLDATGGHGVDHFVDTFGGSWLMRAANATRIGGTVSLVGFVDGTTATIDVPAVVRRSLALRALSGGSRDDLDATARFVEASAVRPVVDSVFSFDRTRDAYARLAGGGVLGKVVIRVDGAEPRSA